MWNLYNSWWGDYMQWLCSCMWDFMIQRCMTQACAVSETPPGSEYVRFYDSEMHDTSMCCFRDTTWLRVCEISWFRDAWHKHVLFQRHHLAQSMCILNTEGSNIFENLSSRVGTINTTVHVTLVALWQKFVFHYVDDLHSFRFVKCAVEKCLALKKDKSVNPLGPRPAAALSLGNPCKGK